MEKTKMNAFLATVIPAAGLEELWSTVLSGWVAPLFIAGVAVFAIFFIKDRKWTQLISFVGIAAVVGVLIFAGPTLFGDGGTLQGVAENAANEIN
jgi:hypothetical protein